MPRGPDHPHGRGDHGREERHLPPLQLHLARAAALRLRRGKAGDRQDRHRRRRADEAAHRARSSTPAARCASSTRRKASPARNSNSPSRSARRSPTSGSPPPSNKIILNLPATVEYATPNVHADQIEWMCTHLTRRALTIVSLHTHNDRGTGVAATELGLLAGADRVEGTLFGNGERTGNLDIVTVALNLYTHGHPSGPRFHRHQRHPRGLRTLHAHGGPAAPAVRGRARLHRIQRLAPGRDQEVLGCPRSPGQPWDVLYIPLDPADIGRTYRAIIRINSQSGKGGVAYVMEKEFGYALPKAMHKEFGRIINDLADQRKDRDRAAGGPRRLPARVRQPRCAGQTRAFPHHRARQPGQVRGVHPPSTGSR